MTRATFVNELLEHAKQSFHHYWHSLPDEQRLRLAAMERELGDVVREVDSGLWALLAAELDALAVHNEGQCSCGRRRERRRATVKLDLLGKRVEFPCTYLYCRACKQGLSPVRRWLGLEHGEVSMGFERATTDLTTRMTFGDAVESMQEHHGQQVDRTKAERVTYRVGIQAQAYLSQRRRQAHQEAGNTARQGSEQLLFTADGGAIPIGTLNRPATAKTESAKTEVRKLPKGKRQIAGREARFISVHDAAPQAQRVVDCHIAPYESTGYTGERMFTAAVHAGLTDTTKLHGVFDMGKWIQSQFEEQFFCYDTTACADIMHVTQYLIDAGRAIVGQDKATAWGMERKYKLLAGTYDAVLADLREHVCQPACPTGDGSKCLVRVAQTYLENNARFMQGYADFMASNLPVGSGEAESGIRHIIKRRMSVAGAWTEEHAQQMLALLTIRSSGWWDHFWQWRDELDREAWRSRQQGNTRVAFRRYRKAEPSKQAA